MRNLVTRFAKDDEGATMVEYGLLICFIALVAGVGAAALGNSLNGMFEAIAAVLPQNVTTP